MQPSSDNQYSESNQVHYSADVPTADPQDVTEPDGDIIRWQAAEYIHHDKPPAWFAGLGVVTIVLMAIAIFLVKSITFAVLIPVMTATLVVYAYRPPRMLDYTLSRHGLHTNDRLYSFGEFKSFVVMHGEEQYSILLIPTKRFQPGVTVYFPEEVGEVIVDMLAARLPMEERHVDFVDRLIRHLRI